MTLFRFTLGSLGIIGLTAALVAPAEAQQRVLCGTRSTFPCSAPGNYVTISAGLAHSCGVRQDGSAWCWGDGREGALGNGRTAVLQNPQRVRAQVSLVDVQSGGGFSCGRSVDDAIYCWGNAEAVPGWREVQLVPVRVPYEGVARSLSVGRRHACVLDAEGQASCWGFNVDGETGTGVASVAAPLVPRPTLVATEQRFAMISAGLGVTCGVNPDGKLYCWGSNIDGILGTDPDERCGDVNPIPCSSRPIEVPLAEKVTRVSVGSSHACVVTAQGAVLCWGSNGAGQVGAYTSAVPRVRVPSPVPVPRSGPFVSVSSGGIHTCALTASRLVYCWGADQLSLQEEVEPASLAPRQVARGTQFRAVSAGSVHACALDTRGRLLCWGDTILGALGSRQ